MSTEIEIDRICVVFDYIKRGWMQMVPGVEKELAIKKKTTQTKKTTQDQ